MVVVMGPVYREHDPHLEDETGLCTQDALLQHSEEGCARMVISNPSSYPQVAESGTTIREVIAHCSGGSGCIARAR